MAVILVVEDEALLLMNAEWLILELGHTVLLAGDLREALLGLSSVRRLDALFVDIRLAAAVSGGFEVADRGVEQHPQLRVLYTSASTLTSAMTDCFVPGGLFLNKPYSPAELETSICELLC